MHKELVIENFKCFSDKTSIKLGNINVCLGSNSVGKSSVIQSCILIRQIYEQAKLFKDTKVKKYKIQLNDIYGLQLGDAEHIKSSKDKDDIILKIDESVFLVENPEAHLHPKGQSHIGYFLAMMAFAGVQIIAETHSEHVLNGIRIAALKNKISPEEICIHFFSINKEEGGIRHRVEQICLTDRMDLESWPDGFMDQEEEDLRTLRELRRK